MLIKRTTHIVGWGLGVMGCAVYLLTLAPTVSFWDCGEFIATSHGLQVGHPPGAPFYQLIAHLFTLLATSAERVAWWSNALSAVCGGGTVMMLYWTLRLMMGERKTVTGHTAPMAGALCYLFCDTAWFSAVESEVYSMSMLMASTMVWCGLRWYQSESRRNRVRWLVLTALLAGLSVCVHLMCLLALPAVAVLLIAKEGGSARNIWQRLTRWSRQRTVVLLWCVMMFGIGLTPYLIIPIRAAANPPINCGTPATTERFADYVQRKQYAHAPLYPRMWRHQGEDDRYAALWSGGRNDVVGNACYFASYQLCYMYLRYLMWNFSGRYSDWQGFGSLQKGQFITGIGPIDRLIVGTSARPPETMPVSGRQVYFLLPFLLGLIGLTNRVGGARVLTWMVAVLFLFGGPVLAVYLNHPVYEPRERDYAYVLSFYAFCMWIGVGAGEMSQWVSRWGKKAASLAGLATLAVPLLMAVENWPTHDRTHQQVPRDVAANILGSCPSGALLFTWGDNDTFPLWYLQQVEHQLTDVEMHNVNLLGAERFWHLIDDAERSSRPVYFSHYAYDALHRWPVFEGRMRLSGYAYQLGERGCDSVDCDAAYDVMMQNIAWHEVADCRLNETAVDLLSQYWQDVLTVATALEKQGETDKAQRLLRKTMGEIGPERLYDLPTAYAILTQCQAVGMTEEYSTLIEWLAATIREWSAYYGTLSPRNKEIMQRYISPLDSMEKILSPSGDPTNLNHSALEK